MTCACFRSCTWQCGHACMYLQQYVLMSIMHTHIRTQKHRAWLSQRPEFAARVPLCCSCTAAVAVCIVYRFCAVAFEIPRRLWVYIVLPPAQHPIHGTSLGNVCSFLLPRSTGTNTMAAQTRTHRCTVQAVIKGRA